MTTYRGFEIARQKWSSGYVAVHEAFEVDYHPGGGMSVSHPVFYEDFAADCMQKIDDWYKETGGKAWKV